jgi:hypothetical protein
VSSWWRGRGPGTRPDARSARTCYIREVQLSRRVELIRLDSDALADAIAAIGFD